MFCEICLWVFLSQWQRCFLLWIAAKGRKERKKRKEGETETERGKRRQAGREGGIDLVCMLHFTDEKTGPGEGVICQGRTVDGGGTEPQVSLACRCRSGHFPGDGAPGLVGPPRAARVTGSSS